MIQTQYLFYSVKTLNLFPLALQLPWKKEISDVLGIRKKMWWFLKSLLGLYTQDIWLDMKECSSFLQVWLLGEGRCEDPVFFLCIFQSYYPIGLVHISHLSKVISRQLSILKEWEEEGFHQQEINGCKGNGSCLFSNGLTKCWETLLFNVSYIIQDFSF